ncbi:MAG TPA: alpha/beta hydrolase [Galbitalea sp.]
MPDLPRPPYDPEFLEAIALVNAEPPLTVDTIVDRRSNPFAPPIEVQLEGHDVLMEHRTIPGPDGDPDIEISIFRKPDHVAGSPGIYHTHGGGMISGDRFGGMEIVLEWLEELDAVVVSVDYRLAPEHPDPAPVNDCYAGLKWMAEHADELGFDPARLMIAGGSAGGGLAAGVTLMARDLGAPALAASMLIYPMIDDANDTVSSHQFDGIGVWPKSSNEIGWNALLGDRRGRDDVSIYAVPARAKDLSNLPPTYIDVGSAEVFRDEDVAYASRIWAAGGECELHVWSGAFHGSDLFMKASTQSTVRNELRTRWVKRTLGG